MTQSDRNGIIDIDDIGGSPEDLGEGLFSGGNQKIAYYNMNGDEVVQIQEFAEGIDILDAGGFSGGFAHLLLKWHDGKQYSTVIDRSGQIQYDPIRTECINSWCSENGSYNGYLDVYDEDNNYAIITPNG